MTYQDIADELQAIAQTQAEARAEQMRFFEEKRQALRADCERLGHIWAAPLDNAVSYRTCVVCGAAEAAPQDPEG